MQENFVNNFRNTYVREIQKFLREYSEGTYFICGGKVDESFTKLSQYWIKLFFEPRDENCFKPLSLCEKMFVNFYTLSGFKDLKRLQQDNNTAYPALVKVLPHRLFFMADEMIAPFEVENLECLSLLKKHKWDVSSAFISLKGNEDFYTLLLKIKVAYFLHTNTPVFDELPAFLHGWWIKRMLQDSISSKSDNDSDVLENSLKKAFYYFKFKGHYQVIEKIDELINDYLEGDAYYDHPITCIQTFSQGVLKLSLPTELRQKFIVHFSNHPATSIEYQLASNTPHYLSTERKELDKKWIALEEKGYQVSIDMDQLDIKKEEVDTHLEKLKLKKTQLNHDITLLRKEKVRLMLTNRQLKEKVQENDLKSEENDLLVHSISSVNSSSFYKEAPKEYGDKMPEVNNNNQINETKRFSSGEIG